MIIINLVESRRDGIFYPVFRPYGTFCGMSEYYYRWLVPLGPDVPNIILLQKACSFFSDSPY